MVLLVKGPNISLSQASRGHRVESKTVLHSPHMIVGHPSSLQESQLMSLCKSPLKAFHPTYTTFLILRKQLTTL